MEQKKKRRRAKREQKRQKDEKANKGKKKKFCGGGFGLKKLLTLNGRSPSNEAPLKKYSKIAPAPVKQFVFYNSGW